MDYIQNNKIDFFGLGHENTIMVIQILLIISTFLIIIFVEIIYYHNTLVYGSISTISGMSSATIVSKPSETLNQPKKKRIKK
jgi:hypothetical protein